MSKMLSLLLLPVLFTALSLAQYWKSPYWQSIYSAQQDCAGYLLLSNETLERFDKFSYPDEPSCRKLINCVLIDLRSWNETTGVKDHVLSYFFRAAPGDTGVKERVQQCIADTVPPPGQGGKFERPYRAFKCYQQNYAEIVREEQFVPIRYYERIQQRIESFSIVNTSCQALREFSKGNILNVPEFKDVFYTLLVRTGFYSPEGGDLNLDLWYKQFGVPGLLSDATRQCVTTAGQQNHQEPERSFQICSCLFGYVTSASIFQEAASYVVVGPNVTCNRCDPEPTYSCRSQPTSTPTCR